MFPLIIYLYLFIMYYTIIILVSKNLNFFTMSTYIESYVDRIIQDR